MPLVKQSDGSFELTVPLPAEDKILYKYVVDGEWLVSKDQSIETDDAGNDNNVLSVSQLSVLSSADGAKIPEAGGLAIAASTVSATVMPSSEGQQATLGEPGVVIPQDAEALSAFETVRNVDPKTLNETPELTAEEKKKQKKKLKKTQYKLNKKKKKAAAAAGAGEETSTTTEAEPTPEPAVAPEAVAAAAAAPLVLEAEADAPAAAAPIEEPVAEKKVEAETPPVEETAAPVEESVVPVEETVVPVDESVVPVEKSAVPVEETVVPVEESAVEESVPEVVAEATPVTEAAPVTEGETTKEVDASPVAKKFDLDTDEIIIAQGGNSSKEVEDQLRAANGGAPIEEIQPTASEALKLTQEGEIQETTSAVEAAAKSAKKEASEEAKDASTSAKAESKVPAKGKKTEKKKGFFSKLKKIFK